MDPSKVVEQKNLLFQVNARSLRIISRISFSKETVFMYKKILELMHTNFQLPPEQHQLIIVIRKTSFFHVDFCVYRFRNGSAKKDHRTNCTLQHQSCEKRNRKFRMSI